MKRSFSKTLFSDAPLSSKTNQPTSSTAANNQQQGEDAYIEQLKNCLTFGEYSIQGDRAEMEDSTSTVKDIEGTAQKSQVGEFAFFGVFDGHGGDRCSAFVSDRLPNYVLEVVKSGSAPREALQTSIARVEKEYHDLCMDDKDDGPKDGTTCVCFVLHGNTLTAANVGDSEFVLCKNGQALAPFAVHNPKANPAEEERVKREGGLIIRHHRIGHPLRPNHASIAVSRTIGDIKYKEPVFTGDQPTGLNAVPDLFEHAVLPDADFALLACDGVWDVMSHEDAIAFCLRNLQATGNSHHTAKALVKEAYKRGSTDNITALVVAFKDYGMKTNQS